MEQTTSTTADASAPRSVVERVRESATSQLSTQKDRATNGLGTLAQAVRHSTQSFRDNQQDTVARYIEKAADQIERLSTRLRERDISDLLRDGQQFARRQPAMFIGAAFAFGLVTARFLKSSAGSALDHTGRENRYDRSTITPRYAGGGM